MPPSGRVAFYDDHPYDDAGAARWTRTVATALSGRGWRVSIVFPHEGAAASAARSDGLPVVIAATPQPLRRYGSELSLPGRARAGAALPGYWWALGATLGRLADVVHVNDHRGLLLAAPAARLRGLTLVWHVHSAHPSVALNRLGTTLAHRVAVPATAVPGACPGLPRSAVVLPPVVEERWFAAEPRPPVGPPLVVSVGRLHPVKRFDVLLRAAAELLRRGHTFRVVIAGGPQAGHEHHAQELRSLRESLGLATVVALPGQVPDVAALLREATVYVQSSAFETAGLAALQAMAAGLPLVATDVGGLGELVRDGTTGWPVPPGDATALADALEAALRDPDRRSRYGQAGRRRARGYSVAAATDLLETLYRELLTAHR